MSPGGWECCSAEVLILTDHGYIQVTVRVSEQPLFPVVPVTGGVDWFSSMHPRLARAMSAWTVLLGPGCHFSQFTGFQALRSSLALLLAGTGSCVAHHLTLLMHCLGHSNSTGGCSSEGLHL